MQHKHHRPLTEVASYTKGRYRIRLHDGQSAVKLDEPNAPWGELDLQQAHDATNAQQEVRMPVSERVGHCQLYALSTNPSATYVGRWQQQQRQQRRASPIRHTQPPLRTNGHDRNASVLFLTCHFGTDPKLKIELKLWSNRANSENASKFCHSFLLTVRT
jgi:hypothetical protein